VGPNSRLVTNRKVYDSSKHRTPIFRSPSLCLAITFTQIFTDDDNTEHKFAIRRIKLAIDRLLLAVLKQDTINCIF
jgi:hypothetical protein